MLNEDIYQIRCYPSLTVRYELSELSEAIGDYYDSVVGFLSHQIS
jgi:hypothetical protein